MRTVSVAIPVRNGGPRFAELLDAVAAQRVDADVELVVCDSASSDDSAAVARAHGAQVVSIRPEEFSHGGTRNLLMRRTSGEHVAFLTQDAVPASDGWLAALLAGFEAAGHVALTFGPYEPEPGASQPVAAELRRWFGSFGPAGELRVDRLGAGERSLPPRALLGPRGFFTDANGCVARAAWEQVPYREIAHTEDHQLAVDLLRAGWAKVFVPNAVVVHSHEYGPAGRLRRSFDEWRGLHEVYGLVEGFDRAGLRRNVIDPIRDDIRELRASGAPLAVGLARSVAHHGPRWAGALLGGRARRLPAGLRRRLSAEGRA